MTHYRRNDGIAAATAAHGQIRDAVVDAAGAVVFHASGPAEGSEAVGEQEYRRLRDQFLAERPAAEEAPPMDSDQEAIDAFAGGDDGRQAAALRAIARRLASPAVRERRGDVEVGRAEGA